GPHCRVIVSGRGRAGGARRCPTVGAGIVSPAGVQIATAITSAPDDHFAAGPHCRVIVSGTGRARGAGSCPTTGGGIVSPAGVQKHLASIAASVPDAHLAVGPHCRVIESASGRAGGASCPRVVRAGN